MWTYRLRYVRCGKPNCGSCRGGYGHGPYWYGYEHRGDKVYSKYFGKAPVTGLNLEDSGEPEIDPRWVFKGRMDWRTAMRIMGFTSRPDPSDLTQRWRSLVNLHHPDRGGDVRICAAINVAYGYLKS